MMESKSSRSPRRIVLAEAARQAGQSGACWEKAVPPVCVVGDSGEQARDTHSAL